MHKLAINLEGKRFSRITVKRAAGKDRIGNITWRCVCACGTRKVIRGIHLRRGLVKSCGCLRREAAEEKNKTHWETKGRKWSYEYRCLMSIRSLCKYPSHPGYKYYGGRGIKVCRRWAKFENFLADMGRRPAGCRLVRKRKTMNFTPSNCSWCRFRPRQDHEDRP